MSIRKLDSTSITLYALFCDKTPILLWWVKSAIVKQRKWPFMPLKQVIWYFQPYTRIIPVRPWYPKIQYWQPVFSIVVLQCLQHFLASRCAMMRLSDSTKSSEEIPIIVKRVSDSTELFVCKVESTR